MSSISSFSQRRFELRDEGSVIFIENALYDSQTKNYYDITVERKGGRKFNGITPDEIRRIQDTYRIAIETLKVAPDGAAFTGDAKETTFFCQPDMKKERKSLPSGQQRDDVFLSLENARFLGASPMTLHDALKGVWSLGAKGGEAKPSGGVAEVRSRPANAGEAISTSNGGVAGAGSSLSNRRFFLNPGSHEKEIAAQSKSNGGSIQERIGQSLSSFWTPYEAGYDSALPEERKRRMILHLDANSSPGLLFSSFVDYTAPSNMQNALRSLAKDPNSDEKDAKLMRESLECWSSATYHYLDKNSNPLSNKPLSNEERAQYWRDFAPRDYLRFIPLFSDEKIDSAKLCESLVN